MSIRDKFVYVTTKSQDQTCREVLVCDNGCKIQRNLVNIMELYTNMVR